MKGDFSRETFDPAKHYAGVRMQQGRVQSDADWNEQEAIQRRLTQVEARDVIGACGAPKSTAGFAIAVSGGKLTIGAGRYYVDGLLAENETDALPFESQPAIPEAPTWVDALKQKGATRALVYLDVWERHVTALDDPRIREVALGGADTATRVQTAWRVRVLAIEGGDDPAALQKLQQERATAAAKLVQLQATGGSPGQIQKLQDLIAKLDAEIAASSKEPTCDAPLPEWDDLIDDPDRRLNARAVPPGPLTGPCIVAPTAGFRRLENQLYRVEIHTPTTFKWSRDDGAVVTTIEKLSGKELVVGDLGNDAVLGFASGQWVEIADDRHDFEGTPGELVQIDSVELSTRTITLKTAPAPLDPDPSGVDPDRHPKLRRWDQSGAGASATGVAITGAWQALEDGVEVQLADANYRTGDYWVVPARTATGELEWPPFAIPNASPQAQPRRGIHHHFCRLALLELDATSKAWTVAEDCRQVFAPLTEPCCGKSTTALHVVDTNWTNDDSFPPAQAAKEGLRIRLDSAADPASLTNDTVQVAVEAPTVLKGADASVFVHRVYVRGVVERDAKDPAIVVWRPAFDGFEKAVDGFRARVKLVGSCIWGDGEGTARHLDGRTLGKSEPPGGPPPARIALVFPSGGGGDASDFDSWFTFGAATHAPPKTFQAIAIKLTSAQNAPSSAGTVQLPLAPGAKVAFKAGEQIRFLDIAFNRDVEPKSVPAAPLTSVFVDQIAAAGAPKRLVVDLQVAGASVRVTLRDPSFFSPGNYVLTCIGTAPTAAIAALPVVRSKGDAAALDGDFDDKDGGNLTVPFTVT